MRLGLIGPSGDIASFERAFDLFERLGVDRIVYLGTDSLDARFVASARITLFGEDDTSRAFLAQAALIAPEADGPALRGLLARHSRARLLQSVVRLPVAPSRGVEMFDDRIVLFVHDANMLDEDDIATASLVVHARSPSADLRHFGPRAFLSPGPLSAGRVACLDGDVPGRLGVALYTLDGDTCWNETLTGKRGKITVS